MGLGFPFGVTKMSGNQVGSRVSIPNVLNVTELFT